MLDPGRISLCGYDDATNTTDAEVRAACRAAPRAPRATFSAPVGVGTYTAGMHTAQWVEVLVRESGCTTPQLRVGKAEGYNESVYVHAGCTFPSDLTYGDSDHAAWGLTGMGLDYSARTTTTESEPTATEDDNVPGLFHVTCSARITDGWGVGADGTHGTSTTVTASETASTAPAVCKG